MTSKEALEQIKNFRIVKEHESIPYEIVKPITEYYAEEVSIIEKDIEILEILKCLINDLEETFNSKYFSESCIMGTIIKDYFIDNDITGKVEEWLGNDK